MNRDRRQGTQPRTRWLPRLACCLGLLLPSLMFGEPPATRIGGYPPAQALQLGERMYREGLLPSGKPMRAVVKGDIPLSGTTFTCVSCHLRSGLGSNEGQIITVPTNAARLFKTDYRDYRGLSQEQRDAMALRSLPRRPAYTEQSLATAIEAGLDPNQRELHPVMPRYDLSANDMAVLIHYLKSLSAEPSPGVTDKVIRFATVITDEVSQQDREAMLVPLRNFVSRHNNIGSGEGSRMAIARNMQEMSYAFRTIELVPWILKGPANTWATQLSALDSAQPVFALIGGISYGSWRPIHDFCETHRIPCILPITDDPVVTEKDWYTLYFNKGPYQEGLAAAHYLANQVTPGQAPHLLQIFPATPAGEALAKGFRQGWVERRLPPIKEIRLPVGKTVEARLFNPGSRSRRPPTVLLWTGAESFPALAKAAEGPTPPSLVIMSSSQLKQNLATLPDQARPFTLITYPFRDPKDEPRFSRKADSYIIGMTTPPNPATRISTRAYSLIEVLQGGLGAMEQNYYRDHLLDAISTLGDQSLADFVRLSFGPGQRYASKGCYLMQLTQGPTPELMKKSDWVVH